MEDNQLVDILLAIQKDLSEVKANLASLSGPDGRMSRLEKDFDEAQKWQRLYNCLVVPLVAALHQAAKAIGVLNV